MSAIDSYPRQLKIQNFYGLVIAVKIYCLFG